MIKILIVDDMPIFLEYLRGCIDWKSYGFEICCEARDGKEALQKIEEFYPDVVLTDITMPYINGLELAERITKDYPDISVILITGNNEFEYARKAVKIGVCDYIVKPFEKEELILSLLKLQDNIGKAVENTDVSPRRKNRDERLRALIYAGTGSNKDTEIEALSFFYDAADKERAQLEIENKGLLVALFKFDITDAGNGADSVESLMNWERLIAKMLEDKLEITGKFRVFHDYENNIVVIMRFDDDKELESFKGYEFTDIIQIVKSQLEIDSAIALTKAANISSVKGAYEKALNFLAGKGYGRFFDIRNNQENVSYTSLDAIFRLNRDIESLQADDAEAVINELWSKIKEKNNAGNTDAAPGFTEMNLLSSAVSILMTNIISSGFSVDKIFGEDFVPEKFFAMAETSEKMRENVIFLYKKRIEFEKGKKDSREHDIAQAAKEYIEANYTNSELSISDISEALCVNQTYLRKMFKSEMNMTLTEYITQLRMQEAKRLITTTEEKLSSVAEQVGYSDVSYFSNVFKKYYGTSPRSMKG
ncbi:response regulator transcription factor [Butyrivibrio sp. MC2021]|uniref:response regulator transcription factor n=1 Tax=Butyrivibrio sp. MC2021 TaxID=1408306 RepID=UPI0006867D67|nr:response regulator [Butyrivibrio sp. MC2021]